MWIATTDGFYSAVQHRNDHRKVMVRARSRTDLEHLCERALEAAHVQGIGPIPTPSAIEMTPPPADYPCRVTISKTLWAHLLAGWSASIDYDNFKNAVVRRQGPMRARVYHDVWADLLRIEYEDRLGEWDDDEDDWDDGVDSREQDADDDYEYRTVGLGLVERLNRSRR